MANILLKTLAIFMLCTAFTSAQAAVFYEDGTTYSTTRISSYATTGALMGGMSVTVWGLSGGSAFTETQIWGATGAASGQAAGSGWKLSQIGDSYFLPWTFTVLANSGLQIAGFEIYGGPMTAFDTWATPEGTSDSSLGGAFSPGLLAPGADVTYSDRLALSGSEPVGDLYMRMTVEFTNLFAPIRGLFGQRDRSFSFWADTDTVMTAVQPVPVPAAFWLLGSVLMAGLGLRGKGRLGWFASCG